MRQRAGRNGERETEKQDREREPVNDRHWFLLYFGLLEKMCDGVRGVES